MNQLPSINRIQEDKDTNAELHAEELVWYNCGATFAMLPVAYLVKYCHIHCLALV